MRQIAITAGGTSEPIDGVRRITNISSGRLGWELLLAILSQSTALPEEECHIHYIHTDTAYIGTLTPEQMRRVTLIPVSDAESVYNAVDRLTTNTAIDYFYHSMAISDFTFQYAISKEQLAEEILSIPHSQLNMESIMQLFNSPETRIERGRKISSERELFLSLTKTKKVISLIKKNNPNTCLIGFKLLSNVPDSELEAAAATLTTNNDCDYVFANEASQLSPDKHTGLLIHKGRVIARPVSKVEIAKELALIMHNS